MNYKIFGNKTVDIVIEMGLGACISEWEALAKKLGADHGVLVYERAGINHSDKSDKERTPTNIAKELMDLLDVIPHDEKLVIIGHSQGGLYASEFCGIYPEIVNGLILLDPLSKEDNRFKKELTAKEYKKSGVDKSKNFIILETLTKFGMKGLVKKAMYQAPPFYYADFSKEQKKDILNSLVNITHLRTCREEYRLAHDEAVLKNMVSNENYPDIPIILVTHSSEEAIRENMEFGRNSRPFATRIEQLWQEIMKEYLDYSKRAIWIQAKRSTHYIHLMEPEIIIESVKKICSQDLAFNY
ncbi:MAG: alpha/beta hydrolase [Lachnospiraceae bacterium]|nr:alpha/beta hydrolase [Lachnospiraceae bacterium]